MLSDAIVASGASATSSRASAAPPRSWRRLSAATQTFGYRLS